MWFAASTSISRAPATSRGLCLPNITLTAVFVSGEDGSPLVGAGWFVGVDAQVWTLSSNRGIHEYDVCVQVISDLYDRGIAAAVDPAVLADRLRVLTSSDCF
jgi:hypothetical protein